jgi:prepilin-type N-terminal cleavage/methylation domain-containing protein
VKKNKGFTLLELIIAVVVIVVVATIVLPAILRRHPQQNVRPAVSVPAEAKTERPLVHMQGRFGYIPFPEPLTGWPTTHVDTVLKMLEVFERTNPDKKIVGWEVLRSQSGPSPADTFMYGIWITVETRPNPDDKVEGSGG